MCKKDCKNCVCLVQEKGIWICDEVDKPIKDLLSCPEEVL
jgi:hypothetical protein